MKVVGCILERQRAGTGAAEFLMVHRLPHKADGGTWGFPSGKRDPEDMSDEQAIIRELQEETGYLAVLQDLELLGEYRGKKDAEGEYTLVYPTYRVRIADGDTFVPVIETAAHDEHRWVTAEEAAAIDLIYGLPTVFRGLGMWPATLYLNDEKNDDGMFLPVGGIS